MWRAELVRTRTGQVGARLDVTPGAQITDEINGIPSGRVAVSSSAARRISESWWEPRRNAIVLSHRHRDTDTWVPIMGGPILALPDIDGTTVGYSFAGIQDVLRGRYRTHEWSDYPGNEQWKRGAFYWEGSLGQIAWRIVQEAMAKPRGGLPIVHGTPDERITDDTRIGLGWGNWNLANANVWDQILTGIAQKDHGPDMRFTPRYAADRQVEWVFEHGTHADPRIAHPYTLRVDSTAARPAVSSVKVTISGAPTAHRVYGTGAGEGPGTWIRVAEDLSLTVEEMPLVEAVASDTSASSGAEVLALAQGRVHAGGQGAWQISCTLHTHPGMPLWQIRPGAPIRIKVKDRYPFPDGWYTGRIQKCSYTVGSDAVAIEIEQEAQ